MRPVWRTGATRTCRYRHTPTRTSYRLATSGPASLNTLATMQRPTSPNRSTKPARSPSAEASKRTGMRLLGAAVLAVLISGCGLGPIIAIDAALGAAGVLADGIRGDSPGRVEIPKEDAREADRDRESGR